MLSQQVKEETKEHLSLGGHHYVMKWLHISAFVEQSLRAASSASHASQFGFLLSDMSVPLLCLIILSTLLHPQNPPGEYLYVI